MRLYHTPEVPVLTATPPDTASGFGRVYIKSNGLYIKIGSTETLIGGASSAYAPIDSAALTGTPTAPTPGTSDDSTRIANTAYVQNVIEEASIAYSNIYAHKVNAVLSGSPKAPTPLTTDNSTNIATTEYVRNLLNILLPNTNTDLNFVIGPIRIQTGSTTITYSAASTGSRTITFPTAFAAAPAFVGGSCQNATAMCVNASSLTANSFNLTSYLATGGPVSTTFNFRWLAVGLA